MKKTLIAGATGYLGSHIITRLQNKKADFKVLARNAQKLKQSGLDDDQIIIGQVTDPATLKGKLDGIDVIISTIGITRQKDGLTYMDVDFQANYNLLEEARQSGVKKFIYISAINGDHMRHLKIFEAKEKFVDALKSSELDYCIVRPNGFFSDMKDFLDMARRGKVYLFGNGEYKLNPIHGSDLATAIVDVIDSDQNELIIGGPDILTQNEIAKLALKTWMRPVKIVHLPDWSRKVIINILKVFTSSKTYGPFEFFLTMMGQDNVAPRYGIQRLKTFFLWEVDRLNSKGL